jgi:hypothetical protein
MGLWLVQSLFSSSECYAQSCPPPLSSNHRPDNPARRFNPTRLENLGHSNPARLITDCLERYRIS